MLAKVIRHGFTFWIAQPKPAEPVPQDSDFVPPAPAAEPPKRTTQWRPLSEAEPGTPPLYRPKQAAKIQSLVMKALDIPEEYFFSAAKFEQIVIARQASMALCYAYIPKMSLLACAACHGMTDHNTVIHSKKRTQARRDTNPEFNATIAAIEAQLGAKGDA